MSPCGDTRPHNKLNCLCYNNCIPDIHMDRGCDYLSLITILVHLIFTVKLKTCYYSRDRGNITYYSDLANAICNRCAYSMWVTWPCVRFWIVSLQLKRKLPVPTEVSSSTSSQAPKGYCPQCTGHRNMVQPAAVSYDSASMKIYSWCYL